MSESTENGGLPQYIEPNSGAASQPGGRGVYSYTEAPPEELPDLSEDVKTQIQDDPEGPDAVDPDKTQPVSERFLKQQEQAKKESESKTTARTGEVKTGSGQTIVSEDQAKESGVSPDPSTGGDKPVEPQGASEGGVSDPSKAGEPQQVPTPEGEAPGEGGRTQAEKDSEKRAREAEKDADKDADKADKPGRGRGRAEAASRVKDV